MPVNVIAFRSAASKDHLAGIAIHHFIVNQKATPIGKALLGTIVATTLSNEELSRVSPPRARFAPQKSIGGRSEDLIPKSSLH